MLTPKAALHERHDTAFSGWPLLLVSGLIGGVSGIMAVLLSRWVTNHGGLDSPDKHGISGMPACRLGGVLIVSYVFFSLFYYYARDGLWIFTGNARWVLTMGALFFAIGLFEDIKGILSARIRLISMLLAAAIVLALNHELVIEPVGVAFFDWFLAVKWLAIPVTLLCLVFLPNAFNAADGANGLVSGTSLIVIVAMDHAHMGELTMLLDVAAVSCFIFLIYNVVTAKLFLGDGGAYFLGALVGSAMIVASNTGALPLWYLLSLIFYPVAEFSWSIARRVVRGRSPMAADNHHLHNLVYARLRALTGWPVRANTITGLGIAVLFAGLPYAVWLIKGHSVGWMWIYLLQWLVYVLVWFAFRFSSVRIRSNQGSSSTNSLR
jgi:UDP-N-acetylmuramyl pentapeptide phosphotransferase/UDP-N-acetylglucosamine-1-phosphate transferase